MSDSPRDGRHSDAPEDGLPKDDAPADLSKKDKNQPPQLSPEQIRTVTGHLLTRNSANTGVGTINYSLPVIIVGPTIMTGKE